MILNVQVPHKAGYFPSSRANYLIKEEFCTQLVTSLRLFFHALLLFLCRYGKRTQAFCDFTHYLPPFPGLPQYLQLFFNAVEKIFVLYHVPSVSDIQINTWSCYFNLKMYDKLEKTEARDLGYFKFFFGLIADGLPVSHFIHRNYMMTHYLMTRFLFLEVRSGSKMVKTVGKSSVLSSLLWNRRRHYAARCHR
jgi:hypothetical protein